MNIPFQLDMPWHFYVMVAMYVLIGIMHFLKPKAFMRVMPRFIPNAKSIVYLSGFAEILLGILLCIEFTRLIAIYAIIAMLAGFLIVHWNMIVDEKYHKKFPKTVLWLRFFLQFGLMYWAFYYIKL